MASVFRPLVSCPGVAGLVVTTSPRAAQLSNKPRVPRAILGFASEAVHQRSISTLARHSLPCRRYRSPQPGQASSNVQLYSIASSCGAGGSAQLACKSTLGAASADAAHVDLTIDTGNQYKGTRATSATKTSPLAAAGKSDLEEEDAEDTVSWKECEVTPKSFVSAVGELCKVKLSGLVVASGVVGFAMAPDAGFTLANIAAFTGMTTGTALCVFSANSFNQWLEVPFDAQMKRTRNRPLVRGALRPIHAVGMASAFGIGGASILYATTNPLTTLLGVGNIVLYAGVYTYMKRQSIWNTWAGSVVGAIPPMMGWTAVTGSMDPGGWLLAATLFAWQFPHFNALSWNLRGDYSRAGYRMMSVVDSKLCKRVALRYSAAMIPIAIAFPYFDLTSWWLAIDATALNGFLTYRAWKFYKDDEQGSEQSARRLFFDTLWHLPAIMLLYYLHKRREGNGPWYPMDWRTKAQNNPA